MPTEVAKYQFLSWARKGIAAHINEPDTLGNPGAALPPGERATVPVGVSINAVPQTPKDFGLIGAGDIIGVHRDMIVRTEPRAWATSFEPNYLAFIEFYDEDFPWRYTPAKPQGDQLRPWLFLLVLKESEFARDDRRLPLPVVKVKSKDPFPPADETWLFAHVHTEEEIGGTYSTLELYLKSLQKEITTDPDKIYSRLLSPRHLEPNQAYHAFLVPAFEVGRLAGLGLATTGIPAQQAAWGAGTAGLELPFYFDWFFRTGEQFDFESLVQLILPRVLDPRIGMRKMDCSAPGFVRVDAAGRALPDAPGSHGLPAPAPPIQGLEGALKTDRTVPLPPGFTPNAFQAELQTLVNLPQTVATDLTAAAGSEQDFLNDPIVTVPFYGQNHARARKSDSILLDVTQSGWYHALNRDPRTRVPAGFGTSVVQKHQEKFMQKAWQQVNRIYEANRKMRQYQFMIQVSLRYEARHFATLPAPKLLAITSAVHAKVMGSPTTIRHQLSESRLGLPVFAPAFRRLTRPAGRIARRLGANGNPLDFTQLVGALNEDRITPAPPRGVPEGIPAVDDLARRIQPRVPPAWLRWLMAHRMPVFLALLLMLAIAAFATGLWLAMGAAAGAAVAGLQWLRNQASADAAASSLIDPEKAVAEIMATPPQPAFNVKLAGETTTPPATPSTVAGADSVEAANFRSAALALTQRAAIRPPAKPPLAAFDLDNGHLKIARAIHPAVSFPRRLSALLQLPGRPISTPEQIVDVMTHPDIDDAMYAHLRDIDKELLIPNLQLIPPNTISLLETNPPFIESYMVGLNHEMARELLWREYPTDLRGSYFRQFWEVKGISNPSTPAAAELLKDITKIHTWPAPSALGSHKPQPPAGAVVDVQPGEEQLVLVIRGELLKRYPNTVIYAQKAILKGGSLVIETEDLSPANFKRHFKFPLFRAEIESDLRFFGFDLTIEKAKGTSASVEFPGDKLGWFFVIQEVPGEPRFGMDISYQRTRDTDDDDSNDPLDTWDNLAWDRFGATQPAFVRRMPAPQMPRPNKPVLAANSWGTNAANMAYILYQSPVMVAVHATEMLDMSR